MNTPQARRCKQGCVWVRPWPATRAICQPPAGCEVRQRAFPAAPDLVAFESMQWVGPSADSNQQLQSRWWERKHVLSGSMG